VVRVHRVGSHRPRAALRHLGQHRLVHHRAVRAGCGADACVPR
jgi:hypothetical protein